MNVLDAHATGGLLGLLLAASALAFGKMKLGAVLTICTGRSSGAITRTAIRSLLGRRRSARRGGDDRRRWRLGRHRPRSLSRTADVFGRAHARTLGIPLGTVEGVFHEKTLVLFLRTFLFGFGIRKLARSLFVAQLALEFFLVPLGLDFGRSPRRRFPLGFGLRSRFLGLAQRLRILDRRTLFALDVRVFLAHLNADGL
ncbi:MAG: hypothetical protein WC809_20470, partial [Sinimarinibacterium sp.]